MASTSDSQPPAAGEAAHTPVVHYQIINGVSSWEVQESYGPNSTWVTIAGCPDFAVAQKVKSALRACNSQAALVAALESARDRLDLNLTAFEDGQRYEFTVPRNKEEIAKINVVLAAAKEGQS